MIVPQWLVSPPKVRLRVSFPTRLTLLGNAEVSMESKPLRILLTSMPSVPPIYFVFI